MSMLLAICYEIAIFITLAFFRILTYSPKMGEVGLRTGESEMPPQVWAAMGDD